MNNNTGNNGNGLSYNSFLDIPEIPYKIIDYEIVHGDERIWKLLKYPTKDALSHNNLTLEEKRSMIWTGNDTNEQLYNVFLKSLIGNSIDDASEQSQLRIYKLGSKPTNQYQSVSSYEFDIVCHEKCSNVYYGYNNSILCERTDVIESLLLNDLNGNQVTGVGFLKFDRQLDVEDISRLNISNSKSFYGRSLIMSVRNMVQGTDGCM